MAAPQNDPGHSPRQLLLPTLALLAAAWIVFPGLFLGNALPSSHESGWASDLLDVALPLRAYAGQVLKSGKLPLWYPGCFGGLPLAAIAEAVPYYPPSTFFYLLFDPQRATAWSLALHLILAGAGMAFLARRLGAGWAGQILAGLSASLGLWLPNHFRQMNLMQSAAWVPWVWLALERWLERGDARRGAQLGLVLGLMTLAGHLQILHHTIVALAIWTAARLEEESLQRRRFIKRPPGHPRPSVSRAKS